MNTPETDRNTPSEPRHEPPATAKSKGTRRRNHVVIATAVLVGLSVVVLLLAQAVDQVQEAADRIH
jgi:hypothetical protein